MSESSANAVVNPSECTMLLFPELPSPDFISLLFDWNMFFYGAWLALGAAGLASVFAHERQENVELDFIKRQVAELESLSTRTLEQNDTLATLYANWAIALYDDEDSEFEDIVEMYGKAEAILKATLAQGDDSEARKNLAAVYLDWGNVNNTFGEIETAADTYQKAVEVLKPLDDAGDGEAKYDIAGTKLNLGVAYRELGYLEKAKTCLDESFTAYRALEKITDDDTRFYMATVSVQQGNLFHEMGEPVKTVVDAYNRAMRLFVEVIEDQGQMELEKDLANVLLDRSMVTYEDWIDRKFESQEERETIIDNVLLDISRGIELLEKQFNEGNDAARYDMFHAIVLKGKVLCDAEDFPAAKEYLDRAIEEFADLCENDDMFLMQTAMAYATRAVVQMALGNKELSEQDCLKGSELINQLLQSNSNDEEIQELRKQFEELLGQL